MMTTAGRLGGTADALALEREQHESSVQNVRDWAKRWQDVGNFTWWQDRLRIFVGVPWLMGLHCLPNLVVFVALDLAWDAVQNLFNEADSWRVFWYFLVPVLCSHGAAWSLIFIVLLQKRLLIGRLTPGTRIGTANRERHPHLAHWDAFRRWIHERCVTSHAFENALDPLVNTEALSFVHRMLGAKVGRRVQSDNFQAVDHDCIEIEDFVVFGSSVQIHCDADCEDSAGVRELRPVRLLNLANCLDHAVVQPGAIVGEGAVLGTMTLAHQDACFPPDSISTGAVGERSVLLRTDASASTPARDRQLELEVMRQLNSPLRWTMFNLAQLTSAFWTYIIPHFSWVIATDIVMWMDTSEVDALMASSEGGPGLVNDGSFARGSPGEFKSVAQSSGSNPSCMYVMTTWMTVFAAVDIGALLLTVVFKWLLIGRYKEANHAFFSSFHFRWAAMMNVKGALSPLAENLQGTVFNSWYYRMMGAKVGKNAYLAGLALEYDLLEARCLRLHYAKLEMAQRSMRIATLLPTLWSAWC